MKMLKNKLSSFAIIVFFISYFLIYVYSTYINPIHYDKINFNIATLPHGFEIEMQKLVHDLPKPTEIKKYYKPEVNSVSLTYYYRYQDDNYINMIISNVDKNPYWIKVDNESTSNAFLSYCSKDYISLKIYKNINEINTPYYFSIAIFFQERSYCMTKFKV